MNLRCMLHLKFKSPKIHWKVKGKVKCHWERERERERERKVEMGGESCGLEELEVRARYV